MPPPVNITATTAIDLGIAPVTGTTQDVHDAGTTYTVWYKRTAQVGEVIVGTWGRRSAGSSSGYRPQVTVYSDTGVTVLVDASGNDNASVQFPVEAGVTYYYEFVTTNTTVTPAILTIDSFIFSTGGTPAEGDIFINADSELNGSTILDPAVFLSTTGVLKDFKLNFPVGDVGDILDNGIFCIDDDVDLNTKTFAYDGGSNFTQLGTSTIKPAKIRAHRESETFFLLHHVGTNQPTITQLSTLATTIQSWNLPSTTAVHTGLTISTTGTTAYYSEIGNNKPIKRYDLQNDTTLPDFLPGVASRARTNLLTLKDDTIIIDVSGGNPKIAERYDTNATILNTYTFPSAEGGAGQPFTSPDDPDSFWYRNFERIFSTIEYFTRIQTTTGTFLTTFNFGDEVAGIHQVGSFATTYGNFIGLPISCYPFILRLSAGTGNIVIGKFVDPMDTTTTFGFSIDGGLSPSPFNLMMDQEQYFLNIPIGTYTIVEDTTTPNYAPLFLLSNTTANTNVVTVGTGETVTVAVLNQQHSQYSGLYKIVPFKRSDTYFDTSSGGSGVATTTVGFPWDAQGPLIQDLE